MMSKRTLLREHGAAHDDLGLLGPIVAAIVAGVTAELRPVLEGQSGDVFTDRKSSGKPKRWWDRNAGRTFDIYRNGNRNCAKKADVDRAFELEAKLAPKPGRAPRDEDEVELLRVGIRLAGNDR
jgi:hypothetical protein